MKTHELVKMGVPFGSALKMASRFLADYALKHEDRSGMQAALEEVVNDPEKFLTDPLRGDLAKALTEATFFPRKESAPWKQWGTDLEEESVNQLRRACELPIAVQGALMPDAHVGYGLPIGGTLATDNAVIPYAVGVDIACRMKMTALDLPLSYFEKHEDKLIMALERETEFGIGARFRKNQLRVHNVMDRDWDVSPVTGQMKDKAWTQLGTSGSGNHFVEFGVFTLHEELNGRPPGKYLALLSHSGSRGVGANVCAHYSKVAKQAHRDLPKEYANLAWLDLDSEEGQEYWNAMELMGHYASANHSLIHQYIARNLKAETLIDIENHHNFAWKETHEINGEMKEVIVHRKGATPAGKGVLGIIPGSMATPGFVVRGKGSKEALDTASHGAGRVMSRTAANKKFKWSEVNRFLKEKNVKLLSAGLDEAPMVYKNIHDVMAAQSDLVTIVGQFDPRIVKMAKAGERPED